MLFETTMSESGDMSFHVTMFVPDNMSLPARRILKVLFCLLLRILCTETRKVYCQVYIVTDLII